MFHMVVNLIWSSFMMIIFIGFFFLKYNNFDKKKILFNDKGFKILLKYLSDISNIYYLISHQLQNILTSYTHYPIRKNIDMKKQ